MRTSIRLRLAVSFASIALLAALALGTVLLAIVRGYYAQQERDYLIDNAQALAATFGLIAQTNPSPEALQSQVENLALLSQSRVRLLSASQEVIADSGPPEQRHMISLGIGAAATFQRPITATPPFTGDVVFVSADNGSLSQTAGCPPGLMVIKSRSIVPGSTMSDTIMSAPITASDDMLVSFQVPVAGGLYGFSLSEQSDPIIQRSRQQVKQPIQSADGTLWGYLELSAGPAYGTQIVRSVARGWGIASAVAVLLAAGVGWWASRSISAPLLHLVQTTTQMAGGNLLVRAQETDRKDELGALARAFNDMASRVEDTVVTLRRFVSDAAHEIHTPLTTLHANLDMLSPDEPVIRARMQVARLESLTEELLVLSRIEAERSTQPHTAVELVSLVREDSELYASQAEQADVAFDLAVPGQPLTVRGNRSQLQRAVGNLLDNAIKFTPAGGQVSVSLAREGDQVAIRVEDTGMGIPEEDLPHLFQRFHRGRNAAAYPGSGLGLALVRAIVEGHHGTVLAENLRPGARFTLRLSIDPSLS